MELINELESYVRALEEVKKICLKEAADSEMAAGQYIAYETCQNNLIEIIERSVDVSA